MDSSLFDFVQKFSLTGKGLRVDDDTVDRLNHHYTVSLLLIFTVIISAKQYMGSPIKCWLPQQFPGSWGDYAENYCWVKNTYHISEDIPDNPKQREDAEIGYYQWVPFVLALQALFFYLPAMFWRLSNWQSGIDIQAIVANACRVPTYKTLVERQKAADVIAGTLKSSVRLSSHQNQSWAVRLKRRLCFACSCQRNGNFLTLLYLFVKLLYLTNVIVQLILLNLFLGAPVGQLFGFNLLYNLLNGIEWQDTGIFPRVTYCDFSIRALGQSRTKTIQCVLPVNLFNEKIFLFLWLWFFVVAIITGFSCLVWFVRFIHRPQIVGFVKKYLQVANIFGCEEDDMRALVEDDIKMDGIFVLQLIEKNASVTVASMVMKRLWNIKYKPKPT